MKKWGLILLITFLIMSTAMSAEAAKWVWMAEDSSAAIYIDSDSIEDRPQGSKQFWTKYEFKTPNCTVVQGKCMESMESFTRFFSNQTYCVFRRDANFTDGTRGIGSDKLCQDSRIDRNSLLGAIWKYLYQ